MPALVGQGRLRSFFRARLIVYAPPTPCGYTIEAQQIIERGEDPPFVFFTPRSSRIKAYRAVAKRRGAYAAMTVCVIAG